MTTIQKGDHIQLKGPTNPHKGNLSIGKTYIARHVGVSVVAVTSDLGRLAWFNIELFKVKYAGNGEPPHMDDEEYKEIIAAQDSLDLAKLGS
jgi:hypothetical protein